MMRRFRWLALLFFLTAACTTGRRQTRTLLSADGQMAEVTHVDSGCSNTYTQEHSRVGGGIAVRQTHAGGAVYGGTVRAVSGQAYENDEYPDTYDKARYTLLGGGLMGGYVWDHVALEAGVAGVLSTASDGILPVPSLRLQLGGPGVAWFDLELGSQDPVFYTNLVSVGGGVEGESYRLRGGLTSYAVPIDDSDPGGGLRLAHEGRDYDLGTFADISVWDGRFGFVAGAVLGANVLGRVGLSIQLD
ncbi:MAG: hypothetical protein KC549_16315 [Myxococcales bacterium]|nr:hypothetical protein [Myxococcales bacterium]MCB9547724.1 hypothetical protein [Myxococcales bacterium]